MSDDDDDDDDDDDAVMMMMMMMMMMKKKMMIMAQLILGTSPSACTCQFPRRLQRFLFLFKNSGRKTFNPKPHPV